MTSQDLPRPLTTDHKLLTALAGRLDVQNELLARILDRLPEPPAKDGGTDGGTVELREPAPPNTAPEPVPEQTAKPAPARRPRKTTQKGKTPGKET